MRLGAVILAAGLSTRWRANRQSADSGVGARAAENKLLADFGGKPMVCRAMEALAEVGCERAAVVTGDGKIAALAEEYGMQVVRNDEPELGMSHSIALGVRAMRDMDALLLMAADQPLLTGESLCALIDAHWESCKGIACLRDETHWGNPAVFSSKYFEALSALTGDVGAKRMLRENEGDLLIVDCLHPHELEDADDPDAFSQLLRLRM